MFTGQPHAPRREQSAGAPSSSAGDQRGNDDNLEGYVDADRREAVIVAIEFWSQSR
jgi:hypothetical protein